MTRTVKLELDAKVTGLVNGLKTAQKATADYSRDLSTWRKKNEEHLDAIGDASGKAGLAAAAGLALVAKSAIDWESSWTGVLKTVDGTPEQLGRVEDGLRGLAKELPASHSEIAAVAEAAGQLGIQTDSVVSFTKTMIDLGESTNLGAEQAATSLARFMNIMGTSQGDVGRLGSTLVGLGNNFATTESEIMDMTMRLAGASKQIGLSEGQTMGLAAAMSSVGIEAEAGGSAMSMTMKKIGKAVDTGGDTLDLFAETAGMSSEQFQSAWKDDASGALESFVVGLGKAGEEGESVNAILTELGITGIRESDALLRLSSAGELMGNSMKQGAEEYDSGMALIEEANKRYATTESKIAMAWNGIKDAAIEAGAIILPVVAEMADAVAGLADWFGSLPDSVQGFLTILGGVGAAAGLGIAGVVMMSKKLGELKVSMEAIYGSGGRASKAIGGVSKALGAVAVVGAGLIIGKELIEGINEAARKGQPTLEEYFNLLATGGGIDVVDALDFGKDRGGGQNRALDDFKEKIGAISIEAAVAQKALEHVGNMGWWKKEIMSGAPGMSGESIENALKLEEAMKAVGRAFDMGEIKTAQEGFAQMTTQLGFTDEQIGKLINGVPELKSALTQLATDNGIQIDPNDELGLVDLALGRIKVSAPGATAGISDAEKALSDMGIAADGTVDELDKMLESLLALSTGTLSTRAAERNFQESLDAVTEAIKTNGKSLDETTEKGRANQAVLDAVATSGLGVATSMAEARDSQGNYVHTQEEVQKSLKATYDETLKSAQAFTGNKKEAEALTRELMGIPDGVSVSTWMDTFARDTAEETTSAIDAMPGYKMVQIAVSEDGTAGTVQSRIDEVTGREIHVFVGDDGTVENVQAGIVNIDGKDVQVWVTDDGTVVGTQGQIDGISGKDVTVTAIAETSGAEGALNTLTRTREALIKTRVIDGGSQTSTGRGGRGGQTFSSGGYTGAGSKFEEAGIVHRDEHVIRKESRNKLEANHPGLLDHMNRFGVVPGLGGYASGGRVGTAEKRVKSAQKAYSAIDSKKANKARKQAAKDRLDAAKDELKAAKASAKLSADAAKEARERAGRLSDSRFDLSRDLRRGEITDSFNSGSGMSVVDRMFTDSKSEDLSKGKRSALRRDAFQLEGQLIGLGKQSDSLKSKLEKATEARDRLLEVSKSVSGGLRGEYSLGGVLSNLLSGDQKGPLSAGSFVKSAQGKAAQIKRFGVMLGKLRKKGYNEAIIQEIADLGTTEGTQVGNALLGATGKEREQLNNAYKSMDYWSGQAGDEVTKSMYRGGLDAADGLVSGLESKTKNVEDAFYKLGKDAEKSFRKSLDMHSPSRTLFAAGVDAGDGVVGGGLASIPKVEDAFAKMGYAAEGAFSPNLALAVPPSYEVSRYAQAKAMPAGISPEAITQAVREGMSGWQPMVNIDGRKFYGVMAQVNQNSGKRR